MAKLVEEKDVNGAQSWPIELFVATETAKTFVCQKYVYLVCMFVYVRLCLFMLAYVGLLI